MMMRNDPSGVLSSCDLLVDRTDDNYDSMVKPHQSDLHQYHHSHYPNHHSDSSRSSSVCSSSLSPKTSTSTGAITTGISSATVPDATVAVTLTDIDPQLAQHVEYELGLTKKNGNGTGTRKNAWGNLSYAELISKAITSSAEQRLTLSEIYDWMIKYVPFFRNKVDRISSAGWKNSIRHNLSLHNRFKRVQSEGTGKSSWWMINPDDKMTCGNDTSSSSPASGIKQPRRRLGQGAKSASLSTTTQPKRLRGPRSTKTTRAMTVAQRMEQQQQQQHQTSGNQQIQPSDMSTISIYDTQQWPSQLDTDNTPNHIYEQELYSTSVHTPTTNTNGNSTACLQSTYSYDDIVTNYVGNTSSTNNTNNTGDYSYHHPHQYQSHPQHSHTLYQHHHSSNYDPGASGGYYHHSNSCPHPLDTYHANNPGTYSLQQQQIDPNDEQVYLRAHSISSHSSSSSLSPPTLSTTNNLLPSSSSGSSSSNYPPSHPHKSSLSGGYLHPTSNGTVTLYSHHHQPHHPDIETLLDLNTQDDDIDDDDDLSTLVHHHQGMIDDQHQLSSFFSPDHNHQVISHNDASPSLLRTVLNRPIVDTLNVCRTFVFPKFHAHL
ncbi:unnamed protein product [Adineta ricciae]|uniref:Fork-head domain-containing protein n=1 Tax=Adineta ricciae TaxID=249248 RepID=A0A814T5L0_ADIRI|nr:unnamed protein product [Adineta ricciae]